MTGEGSEAQTVRDRMMIDAFELLWLRRQLKRDASGVPFPAFATVLSFSLICLAKSLRRHQCPTRHRGK